MEIGHTVLRIINNTIGKIILSSRRAVPDVVARHVAHVTIHHTDSKGSCKNTTQPTKFSHYKTK